VVSAHVPPSAGGMEISLPGPLASFVEEQVAERGQGSPDEYVRELVLRERDRARLRRALLQGVASTPGTRADDDYFNRLRECQRPASRV